MALKLVLLLALALLLVSNYMVFFYVPNEKFMGAIQRIFYFHVASATASYLAMFIILGTSLAYLASKRLELDAVTEAAAEIGFIFCSIVMVTGMIWGNAAWNTPFRLEPRLVSSLVLWMIFLAFVLLRQFADRAQVSEYRLANHCAILGVIGALMVPVVIYSVHLLPEVPKLHPVVVENQGLREPSFRHTLLMASIALIMFSIALIWIRAKLALLERRLVSGEV